MSQGQGWISIHRKLHDHWLWKEKRVFSNAEAWIDILLTVNHTEQKLLLKNTLFTVNRGESIRSLESWGKRWSWNKSKVRRFLKLLQNENMIRTKSERKTTRLTVCNYDSYQVTRNDDETEMKRKRNDCETLVTPNNNVNNINNVNNNYDGELENTFTDNSEAIKHLQSAFITQLKNGAFTSMVDALYMQLKVKPKSLTPLLEQFNAHII